jgi:molybdate/tungstate transport system permease protein
MSISSSFISTLIVLIFGVPFAYIMARKDFSSKPFVDALIDLPIIVPQTAAGIALLVLLGPKTPIGSFLNTYFGISFSGSFAGIVACQVFVSSPFLIRSAIHSFESVNTKLENISRSLGAGPIRTFFKISLPLASAGIFNGCILTFSRAVSEAGSIMIVAYRPTTIPVMLNDIFLQYGVREAAPVTVVFIIICIWSFIALKWVYENKRRSILAQ